MNRKYLPLVYIFAGVIFVGGTGYALVTSQFGQQSVESPGINQDHPITPESNSLTLLEESAQDNEPDAAEHSNVVDQSEISSIASEVVPAFTLLRVEKDGSTVIAGSGPENAEILLFDGDEKIAKTTSGPTGDFAFVLDFPLKPGLHELHLLARMQSGNTIASSEAGIINIAESKIDEEASVLISKAGEATRILQKPVIIEEKVATQSTTLQFSSEEIAIEQDSAQVKLAFSNQGGEHVAGIESQTQPETETEIELKFEAEPEPEPELKPLLIEAVDVEEGKIYIAGKGEPGAVLRMYFDNQLLGTTRVETLGTFLFEGKRDIRAGRYAIRADMIDAANSDVIMRAEVSLIHAPEVAEEPGQQDSESVSVELASKVTVPTADEETAILREPENEGVKVIKTGSSVIIRRGDNLWRLAYRNYGNGFRYTTIFEANRDQIRNPDLIYPGQVFSIPEGEDTQSEAGKG